MAIAFVGQGGTSSSKTSGTTLSLTVPTGGHAAGHLLLVWLGGEGPGGSAMTASITDSRGNTYSQIALDQTAAAQSLVYGSVLSTALLAGDTISITFSATCSVRCGCAAEFSGATLTADVAYRSLSGTVVNVTTGAITPPDAVVLIPAAVFVNGPSGDTFSEATDTAGGSGWTSLTAAGTTGGSTTSNGVLHSAYKITTASASQNYSPTLGTARSWGSFIAALKPSSSGSSSTGSATDSVAVSDTAARSSLSPARSPSDSVAATDQASAVRAISRAAADTVTASDTAAGQVHHSATGSATDSLAVSDSAARVAAASRGPADTVTTTDQATRTSRRARSAADTSTLSDAVSGASGRSRSSSDTTTLSDAATGQHGVTKTAADTSTGPSDTVSRQTHHAGTTADTWTTSSQATRSPLNFSRAAQDTLTVNDQASGTRGVHTTAQDTLGTILDAAGRTIGRGRASSDQIPLGADTPTRAGHLLQAAGDTLQILSTATRAATLNATISEPALIILDTAAGTPGKAPILGTPTAGMIARNATGRLSVSQGRNLTAGAGNARAPVPPAGRLLRA